MKTDFEANNEALRVALDYLRRWPLNLPIIKGPFGINMIVDKTMPEGTIEVISAHRDGTVSKVTMTNVGTYEPSEDELLRDMNAMNRATARMFHEGDRRKS